MLFTIALTVGFGSSGRLAGAYGTAVSTTMLLTTALLYKVMRDRWGWSAPTALLASGVFLVVDFAFFAANLLKIVDGGWIPLTFGAIVFIVMTTWHSGIGAMVRRHATMTEPPERFLDRLEANRIPRVPGTAVFLTRIAEAIPPLMIQHVSQIGALPQTVVALTVKFEEIPRVSLSNRLELVRVFEGFWHLTVHYGFVEIPICRLHCARQKISAAPSISTTLFILVHMTKSSVASRADGFRGGVYPSSPSCSATRSGRSIFSTFCRPTSWKVGARSRSSRGPRPWC